MRGHPRCRTSLSKKVQLQELARGVSRRCPSGLQEVPEGSGGGHVRQADVLAVRRVDMTPEVPHDIMRTSSADVLIVTSLDRDI